MSPGSAPRRAGDHWERFAARFVESRGLRVLEQSYRCRLGELDIVCADGDGLVIVEVRARAAGDSAAESIDAHKRRRIVNATRHYLMKHPRWNSQPIRFDVIAIDSIDAREPEVRWIVDAFDSA